MAGRGSRLRPHTLTTPKPLISFTGKSIVQRLVEDIVTICNEEINEIKEQNPGIVVIAHPECPPDVIKASDFAGSTSGMSEYVKKNQQKKL